MEYGRIDTVLHNTKPGLSLYVRLELVCAVKNNGSQEMNYLTLSDIWNRGTLEPQ